jgi:hypothetical protein
MNRDWFHLNNLEILTIVAFAPRPGTDFLHSLLDSHPEIISFDGWLHFHEFFDKAISIYGTKNLFFKNQSKNIKFDNINLSDFFYEFAWSHLHKFDSRYDNLEMKGNLGLKKNEFNLISIDEFVKNAVNLISNEEFTSKNALLAVYGSIALIKGDDLSNKKILLHNVHLQEYLDPLIADFPSVKIIACTRDPRVWSTKIIKTLSEMDLSRHSINMSRALFTLGIDGSNPISSRNLNIYVNTLESLHEKPKEVMTNICNWAGIEYSENLLHSSWSGKIWNGDILSNNIKSFFDTGRYIESKKQWKKDMYFTERVSLEAIMRTEINLYKYKPEFNAKLWLIFVPFFILLPVKYEVNIFLQLFKSRNFHLIIYLIINLIYRYYQSYKKLISAFLKSSNSHPLL